MQSKLAEKCREEIVEMCRKMTAAERLQAFVNQSKVLAEIYRAGETARNGRALKRERPSSVTNQ
jgi:hypothetical protein